MRCVEHHLILNLITLNPRKVIPKVKLTLNLFAHIVVVIGFVVLKVQKASKTHNKQFKSDSARLAFLVWVWFSDYGGQIMCRGRVLHTLIGR